MAAFSAFDECLQSLRSGGVVGIPTETVYGLAASIESERGLRRIFEIKERPFFDPLIVHCSSIEELKSLSLEWSAVHQRLAERFWPGPLTMVVPKVSRVSDLITSGLPSVGLRIPRHPLTLELIQRLGVPVAAPSANKFGKTSPTTAVHVREEFGEAISILDGGPAEVGIESTVLSIRRDKGTYTISILRPGMIQELELRGALEDFTQSVVIEFSESEASPGQLPYHYQPAIPLVIRSGSWNEESWAAWVKDRLHLDSSKGATLHLDVDHRLAARNLYAELRKLSLSGASFICFDRTSKNSSSEWNPIWNRLERAASYQATF